MSSTTDTQFATEIISPSMKNTTAPIASSIQQDTQSEEPTHIDPLSTIASVPSSDDGLDDDQLEGADDSTENITKSDTTIVTQKKSDITFTTTIAALTDSVATSVIATDDVNTADQVTIVEQKPAVASQPQEEKPIAKVETATLEKEIPKAFAEGEKQAEDDEVERIMATSKRVVTHTQQEDEPRRSSSSISRPLSRQDLRRKSSFFNSKDIAVSDRRYANLSSSSTSSNSGIASSMRPIADPRFKNRFQNILAQWKARAGN
ncbi:hypothetical protein BGZ76_009242 [Entomortierella beljakovae]|nr:hypothetical protein BGZ76_009242 [Entomortierella beljakovae]